MKQSLEIIPGPIPPSKRFKNITGKTFGRLLVVSYAGSRVSQHGISRYWWCACDCGTSVRVSGSDLKSGHTRSCGCLVSEALHKRNRTHGMSSRPECSSWYCMMSRCTNPEYSGFEGYGGRGIKVCERWLKLEHFLDDMGPRPSPMHTLDRIDNNGNYEPGNCRWATPKQQSGNTRRNRLVTLNGQTKHVAAWIEDPSIHVSIETFYYRTRLGWSDERALTCAPWKLPRTPHGTPALEVESDAE